MFPTSLFLPSTPLSAGVLFRQAVPADLRPLYHTCYPTQPFDQFQWYFERVLRGQENGRSCWLIAEQTTIIGSGQLHIYAKSAEIANLFVAAEWRNQGIGTAMIESLTAVARFKNLPYVEMGVAEDNKVALSLYQNLGFREDRRLPLNEQAIILRKNL